MLLWIIYPTDLIGGGGSNYTDITKLENIPHNIDIFTYSFPCQDLSQQGKQLGLIKGSRSSLLFQVERILKNCLSLPKVLLLENVKALSHKKFSKEFNNWINRLEKLGYHSTWKVLNSADYGSAQNRERLFMVSTLGDINKFQWPQKMNEVKKDKMLENIIDSKHFNILGPKKTATGAINEFYIRYNILFSKDDSQKVAFIVCLYGRV